MSIQHSTLAVAETDRSQASVAAQAPLRVSTRFGIYEVDPAKLIRMERGLLGFPEPASYVLLDLPGDNPNAFHLLQNVDEPELGFIVLPLQGELARDAEADLDEICQQRRLDRAEAAFLLIATLRLGDEGSLEITVNRRAPVLVDTARMTGRQVVLNDPRYEVQYRL